MKENGIFLNFIKFSEDYKKVFTKNTKVRKVVKESEIEGILKSIQEKTGGGGEKKFIHLRVQGLHIFCLIIHSLI